MDWFDLLVNQGTLKSLLQHYSSKASIFWCSDFFMVQLSHPYITIGKIIALTRQNFVGKVMSLLFNKLSSFVIAFLPRRKHLLISWLQSPSAVIFGAQENKVCHNFQRFPIYLPWSDGTGCHDHGHHFNAIIHGWLQNSWTSTTWLAFLALLSARDPEDLACLCIQK